MRAPTLTRDADKITTAVAELAARAEQSFDREVALTGRRCRERLRSPMRTAVVGRVSTGKSTLLNALLGSAVAPTDGRECTKVVYQFRHDRFFTASLMPRAGGQPTAVPFEGGRLPSELGTDASQIKYVDVTLPTPLLQEVTLIDTPGLASAATEQPEVRKRMREDTGEWAADADALLYCLMGPVTQDEADAVKSFRSGTGAKRLSAGTAIGILTRADQTGDDPRTAWPQAVELGAKMSARHADLFAAVLPVIGLLAETAATGALTAAHARAIGELATAWDRDAIRMALISGEMFVEEPGPVGPEVRRELLSLLGPFGVVRVLDKVHSGAAATATALTQVVRELSGIDEVRRQLNAVLGRRADVLKAARALDDLIDSARRAGDRKLQDDAQWMFDRQEMFPLRVIDMARLLATDHVTLPAALKEQARRMVTFWLTSEAGRPPRASRREITQAVGEWREWAQLADLAGRKVADVMVRAWQMAGEG